NSVKITKKAANITVTAQTGDAIKSDAISADETTGESTIETGKGTVTINGGTLDLTAPGNDGIQADSTLTIEGGAITINAGANGIKANEYNITEVDDAGTALGNVINGAVVINGGTLDITSAEEAIRAAERIDITGGETTLTVTGDAQDAVKAGKNTDTTAGTTTTTTIDVKGIINISDGTLTVLKSTDDAIVSMGDVNITGGTVKSGASASDVAGDFFKVYDNFTMSGGTLDIAAYCDGIQSGKALTVTTSGTSETESNYTAGNVDISGGTINIRTYTGAPSSWSGSDGNSNTVSFSCKGIKANTDLNISGGSITVNSYDDAIHSNWAVTITGGEFDLTTGDDGVHADYLLTLGTEGGSVDDFDLLIRGCYEGLEGSVIYQQSGTMSVTAYDDGMNAAGSYQEGAQLQTSSDDMTVMAGPGSSTFGPGGNMGGGTGEMGPGGTSGSYGALYINGGHLYISNTNGDGVDANGTITINGGITIVDGATMTSEDGLDFDSSVTLNGGYVLTMTSGGMDGISGTYDQRYLLYGFSSSGGSGRPGSSTSSGSIAAGNYAIVDASGNVLCAFSRTKGSIGRITFTSPELVTGGSYSIRPLTVNGASAVKSLYGTIDPATFAFALADGCTVDTSGTSYTMSLY
ncbi:MAG: carbohydrate-binding domain-containing protein, partial [Candidatus Ornithomonoglobus sp.]